VRAPSPRTGNRLVCYCDDCQAFARDLGREDILDEHGGSDIFQTSSGCVEILAGGEALACVKQTSRLLRWYARCCNTPIGNTLPWAQVPFVGLIHCCLDFESADLSKDAVLGPVRGVGFARYATGDPATLAADDRSPLRPLLRLLPIVARARLRGDHKRSPFFDPETGEPVVPPEAALTR